MKCVRRCAFSAIYRIRWVSEVTSVFVCKVYSHLPLNDWFTLKVKMAVQ